jgi:hypothetical protein
MLIAAVRRARRPGCKFDQMVILEGQQGTGKFSALRILGGEWFKDSKLSKVDDKDTVMKLAGAWIYELSELVTYTRRARDHGLECLATLLILVRHRRCRSAADETAGCFLLVYVVLPAALLGYIIHAFFGPTVAVGAVFVWLCWGIAGGWLGLNRELPVFLKTGTWPRD